MKKKIHFEFLLIFIIVLFILFYKNHLFFDKKSDIEKKCVFDTSLNISLENFHAANFQKSYKDVAKGKTFCDSVILWENNVSEYEKVVFATAGCQDFILENGEVKKDFSNGSSGLYWLKKIDGDWKVIDYDDRISPQIEAKDWVRKNEELLPPDVYSDCDTSALWQEQTEKAKKEFGI